MTEEHIEQNEEAVVSEPPVVEQQEVQEEEQKMVPLSALQAERRKRQEAEARSQVLHELAMRNDQPQPEPVEDDSSALVEKGMLKEHSMATKRDILETLYQDMNPEAVQKINQYLKPILDKKPWLAASVDNALNRYARAYEIVTDYMHLVDDKPVVKKQAVSDGQRIVQNAQKPRSPVEQGKSAQLSGVDYLKSIQGKKEFRDYREKVRRGDV